MHANEAAAKRALCGSEGAPADCHRRAMSHTGPAWLAHRAVNSMVDPEPAVNM